MPTNEHHVLVCIGVLNVDALETGVVDQRGPRRLSLDQRPLPSMMTMCASGEDLPVALGERDRNIGVMLAPDDQHWAWDLPRGLCHLPSRDRRVAGGTVELEEGVASATIDIVVHPIDERPRKTQRIAMLEHQAHAQPAGRRHGQLAKNLLTSGSFRPVSASPITRKAGRLHPA